MRDLAHFEWLTTVAQKVTVFLDLIEKRKSGNRAIINYNNREGWKLYTIVSNKYAPKIMETVRLVRAQK